MNAQHSLGDCVALITEDADATSDGDVLYGEVVRVSHAVVYVRAYCATEDASEVVEIDPCLTPLVQLSRGQLDRAMRAGWPSDVSCLHALLEEVR